MTYCHICTGLQGPAGPRSVLFFVGAHTFRTSVRRGLRTSSVCAVVAEIGSRLYEFWSDVLFFFYMQIFHEGSDGEEESLLWV